MRCIHRQDLIANSPTGENEEEIPRRGSVHGEVVLRPGDARHQRCSGFAQRDVGSASGGKRHHRVTKSSLRSVDHRRPGDEHGFHPAVMPNLPGPGLTTYLRAPLLRNTCAMPGRAKSLWLRVMPPSGLGTFRSSPTGRRP
jgi:hypothetical protein